MQSHCLPATAAISALLIGVACSSTAAQQARRPAPTEVVATVGPSEITLAEVDDKAMEQAAREGVKLSQAIYDARRAALDDIIANRLLDGACSILPTMCPQNPLWSSRKPPRCWVRRRRRLMILLRLKPA